jgi:hypothetical protein
MFQTEHHQRILQILQRLNADVLHICNAYFGGGTLLVLDNGEYRESRDIDFICPFGEGYRNLRNRVAQQAHNAQTAYAVQGALEKATQCFQAKSDYRDRCYRSLKIDRPDRIIDGLDLIAQDFGLPLTERTFQEKG